MDPKQKNSLLAAGIVSGLLSLPMTWMTIREVDIQFPGAFSDQFNPAIQWMAFDVTGLNGDVTMLVQLPLWFVVAIAIAANVLHLMKSSSVFAVPKLAVWIVTVSAAIWVTIPALVGMASGKATLGFGWFLGFGCVFRP